MRMLVPLPTLGTLLDFPAGVSVTGVDYAEGTVVLHLDGVDPSLAVDEVTAEYSVDTHDHRSFLGFRPPDAVADQVDPTPEHTEDPTP